MDELKQYLSNTLGIRFEYGDEEDPVKVLDIFLNNLLLPEDLKTE